MILSGKLLKDARRDAGLTQVELAERLGTSQPVVARLESGRSNPRIGTLERAVAATGHRMSVSIERSGYPSIDETLIAGNLRLSPDERVRRFSTAYDGARKIAGAALKRDGSQGRSTGSLA